MASFGVDVALVGKDVIVGGMCALSFAASARKGQYIQFSTGNRKRERSSGASKRSLTRRGIPVGGIGLRPFQYGISSEKQQSGLVHAALLTYDMPNSAWS
ncbi:hypothetical protein KDAU_56160 [Dictyobacter aurantiacus]|uniref:Uncharacterized protein n=1 Tax=Dictyobacter aurantiacus TaxID=1936993 RepID=A0A401ZN32_9CHLR|nr:hypothetical protein KDAU_56160 [Dictyobacter aurantiacus]